MSAHADDPDRAAQVVEQLTDYIEEVHEHLEEHDLVPVDEPASDASARVAPSEPLIPASPEQ